MKCAMRNVKCVMRKSGVSLITVLLFMLVATIAATATYKWITSEGRSSASRMMEREAYQSSVAGIENARTWMTYHANDVGDLIHQFIAGGNKPININGRLRPLQRQGQNYQVWLTGVNTDNATYKVKLISYGEARGGAKHGEAAIFNVDGLYQVQVPRKIISSKSPVKFDYAYFGSGFTGTQNTFSSAVINGNWSGNPITATDGNLIITGNATLSGDSILVNGMTCIGKNLNADNGMHAKGDFFVGGNVTAFVGHIEGNAYVKGDFKTGSQCADNTHRSFKVIKSLTVRDGDFDPGDCSGKSVGEHLCLKGTARLTGWDQNNDFTVGGNVWIAPTANIARKKDNHGSYSKLILGNSDVSKVYGSNIKTDAEYKNFRDSHYITENGERRGCHSKEYNLNAHQYGCEYYWESNKVHKYFKGYSSYNQSGRYYIEKDVPSVQFESFANSYWQEQGVDEQYYTHYAYFVGDGSYPNSPFYNQWDSWNLYDFAYLPYEWRAINSPYCVPLDEIGLGFYSSSIANAPNGIQNDAKYGRPECLFSSWFTTKGSIQKTMPTGADTLTCGESAEENCEKIWDADPSKKCGGAPYFVDDPIVIPLKTLEDFADATQEEACSGATSWSSDLVETLNTCYSTVFDNEAKRKRLLYNEEYLVVKINGTSSDISGKLKGKFVIIVTGAVGAQNNFITSDDEGYQTPGKSSYVFLYLKNGASGFMHQETVKHFFIYNATGDFGGTGKIKLTGTLYIPTSACNKSIEFQDAEMTKDGPLLTSLNDAGIICDKGAPCAGSTGGSGSGSGSGTGEGSGSGEGSSTGGGSEGSTTTVTYDIVNGVAEEYYISMAPQLGITLETQVETQEVISVDEDDITPLEKAFIVLPRVIYLPKDPYGKLSDYYNILPLNGSTLKKSDITVVNGNDDGALDLGNCSDLVDNNPLSGATLTIGTIYKCKAQANGGHTESPVSFWVVIGGEQRGTPPINFLESSQQVENTTSVPVDVKVHVPPHGNDITLEVACPDLDVSGSNFARKSDNTWSYTLHNGTKSAGRCTFTIDANTTEAEDILLFQVSTSNAPNGTLSFQILAGSGYIPASPYTTSLNVASTVTLIRDEVTDDDLDAFCAGGNENCPEGYKTYWPNCNIADNAIWIIPTGVSSYVTEPGNENREWAISLGGGSTVSLDNVNDNANCIVVKPDMSIDLSTVSAGSTLDHLRASIKAKKKTFRVGFVGDVGTGKNPVIKVHNDSRNLQLTNCDYNHAVEDEGTSAKYCYYDVFYGEHISFELEEDTDDENFNYWKCDGTCPAGNEPLANHVFGSITISGNLSYLAHFGESDNHCFFEEFMDGRGGGYNRTNRTETNLFGCTDGVEYCIDYCSNTTSGCDAVNVNSNYKWRLIKSSKNDLDYNSLYGHLSVKSSLNKGKKESERSGVVVMSNVHAGMDGTMKTLMQVPRSSDHGVNSKYIRNSGIILRSNTTVTEFLMLNVYVNSSGYLEAQVCKNGVSDCTQKAFTSTASVSSMVMVSAQLEGDNLNVTVFTSPYYGSQTGETESFDVSSLSTRDRNHEYVGFSMADQNFKIHGIGWHSKDYNADCFDTYPVVKCSFAAVAEGGIIQTGVDVIPWVGYSGWFNSSSCTPKFYYYNGSDASCGTSSNGVKVECPSTGYRFSAGAENEGPHGYQEKPSEDADPQDVKTAKAWLECSAYKNVASEWWTNASAENEFAHCGYFWTGAYVPCANDAELMSNENILASGLAISDPFASSINLREASLVITVDGDAPNLEIWLESEKTCAGGCDGYQSQPITITGTKTIDVAKTFAGDDMGFNLQKITAVKVKNNGSNSATVTIASSCKNSLEIKQCSAAYDGSKWNISIEVTKNRDHVKLAETEYRATVGSATVFSNGANPNCQYAAGDNKKITCTYSDDNPFAGHQGDKYVFYTTIKGNEGQTPPEAECTPSQAISSIEVDCSVSSGTMILGKSVPTFSASITCPDQKTDGCGYNIVFDGTSMIGGEKNTKVDPVSTSPYQATLSSPAIGDKHTYKLVSTEGLFDDCEGEFEVVEPSAITADCEFSSATVAKDGSTTLKLSNISNLEGSVQFTATRLSSTDATNQAISGTSGDISITAPSTAGSYTYKVEYTLNGTKRSVCSTNPTLTVVDGLTCSLSPASTIVLGDDVTFTAAGGGNCTTSSTLTSSQTGAGTPSMTDCKNYTIHPTAPGEYTYTYTFNGDLGTGLHCPSTVSLTVNPPAPVFTCPANWAGTVKSPVSLSLSPSYCDNNTCTMKITGIDNDFVAFTSPRTFTDNSSTTSTNKYTVAIKNGSGTTSHDCDITYTTTSTNYTVDYCKFTKSSSDITEAPTGYPYTDFRIKTKTGFPSNTTGTLKINNSEYNINLYSNGNESQYNNLPLPNVAGTYPYEVIYSGEKICEGNIKLVDPVTCSVNHNAVSSGTSVTFTAAANTTMSSTFSLDIAGKCGFKINGNWKDGNQNQNLSSGTYSQNVTSTTEFTFACNNGYSCSKKVFLTEPASISTSTCTALTSFKKTGSNVVLNPNIDNCASNCSYTITSGSTVVASGSNWTSGTNMNSFTHGTSESIDYTLTVENEYNNTPTTCNFTITYANTVTKTATTDLESYDAGTIYTISVGSNTYNGFGCHVNTQVTSNTVIAELNGSPITLWSYNNWTSRVGLTPNSTDNTLVVYDNAPSDLTCNVNW